jgi:hypothetical protein
VKLSIFLYQLKIQQVFPPEKLENDWLLMDETDDDNDFEFEKNGEKSSHPMAAIAVEEESPKSSDLQVLS